MFPLKANEPYIKETGERSTLGAMFGAGGGGGGYVLPPATASNLGGVKIGSGINVDEDGTISVNSSTSALTQLCAPTTVNSSTVLTLSDDYDKYTFLLVVADIVSSSINYIETSLTPTSVLNTDYRIGVQDDATYTWLSVASKTSLVFGSGTQGRTISIYGIKL